MAFAKFVELAFIGCAAIGVYGFVAAAKDGETRRSCTSLCALRPEYAARNRLAPDFELPSINGGKVRLSSYRGKVVLLNFWTKTWPPLFGRDAVDQRLGQGVEGAPQRSARHHHDRR